jgi:hypothetical protein
MGVVNYRCGRGWDQDNVPRPDASRDNCDIGAS